MQCQINIVQSGRGTDRLGLNGGGGDVWPLGISPCLGVCEENLQIDYLSDFFMETISNPSEKQKIQSKNQSIKIIL